jgi:hypothetical protein
LSSFLLKSYKRRRAGVFAGILAVDYVLVISAILAVATVFCCC